MKIKLLLFVAGVILIGLDYFFWSGWLSVAGLSAILTSVSNDGISRDDWRAKYRPG